MSGHDGHVGRDEYDVVVGAGSAGCAVAGRLTEDASLRVLLLEAGGWSPGGAVHGRDTLRASVRTTVESLYHAVSSGRTGTDDMAVLGPQRRVRGIGAIS